MIPAKSFIFLLKHVVAIAVVTGLWIVLGVFAIPHLPLANKRTFSALLHAQMTVDHEREMAASDITKKKHLLLMGSSVVERGVDDIFLDTLFSQARTPWYSTNSGAGGSFANANLIMLRAMLDQGLHPDSYIYGTILQEFNNKFLLHMDLTDHDSALVKLKEKSLWNAIRYGVPALSPILDAGNFHIYIFAINNAFRNVLDPTILQRLSFGENMFVRDSSYQYNQLYFDNLKSIYEICKARHIPFALYNSPLRLGIESNSDLPYSHKQEAYLHLQDFALKEGIPIWNFDERGYFDNSDFTDTYHLNPKGAHKMTILLAKKIAVWQKGIIEQDVTANSADSVRGEIKDSLVRTVFHF